MLYYKIFLNPALCIHMIQKRDTLSLNSSFFTTLTHVNKTLYPKHLRVRVANDFCLVYSPLDRRQYRQYASRTEVCVNDENL